MMGRLCTLTNDADASGAKASTADCLSPTPYTNAGLLSNVSEEVAIAIAKKVVVDNPIVV